MLNRQQDLYRHPLMERLAVAERGVVSAGLRSCAGSHALQLGAFEADPPPSLPLLPHWVCLHLDRDGCRGDLSLDAAAPLPFADESLDLVWLKHALDRSSHPAQLLATVIRLLAPGGTLVVSGLHPVSGWAAWSRYGLGEGGRLQAPWLLRLALRLSGMPVSDHWRQGSCWPRARGDQQRRNRLGGVYVLVARKERAQILPFVTRLAASRRAESGRLAAVQTSTLHEVPDVAVLNRGMGACKLLPAEIRRDAPGGVSGRTLPPS